MNNYNNYINLIIFTAVFQADLKLEMNPDLNVEYIRGFYSIDKLCRVTVIGVLKPVDREETVITSFGQALHPDYSKLTIENLAAVFRIEADTLLLHKEKHISDVTAKILFKHSSLSDSTDILIEGTADDDFCCKYTIKVKNNINNLELDLSTGAIDFKFVSYPEWHRIITEVTQKVLANESVYIKIRDFMIYT